VVAALARASNLLERTGKVLVAAAVALELGVTDIDGRRPIPLTLETV
jgi:dehydrogenase/reductase SDR family member 1